MLEAKVTIGGGEGSISTPTSGGSDISKLISSLERLTKSIDIMSAKKAAEEAKKQADFLHKFLGVKQDASAGEMAKAALSLGSLVGLVGVIASAIADFPLVSAIMKLFKAIIMLMLWPAKDLLVPALKAMIELAKIMQSANSIVGALALAASVIAGIAAIITGVAAAPAILIGLATGFLVYLAEEFGNWLRNIFPPEKVWKILVAGWDALKNAPLWILQNIILPSWNFLKDVGKWIWNLILLPAFSWLSNVGEKIWGIIVNVWNWSLDLGEKIWNMLLSSWSWTLNIADKIWSYIKQTWTWGLDLAAKLWEWIGQQLGHHFGGGVTTSAEDAVIQGGRIITTDPADYVIATKKPGSLGGGGMTVNINIDRPTLTGQQDINALVKAIEQRLYMNQRRYTSYVQRG